MAATTNLTELVDSLTDDFSGDDIKMEEIVARFERRGFGALLLAPALLTTMPIPGVPTLGALLIIFITAQRLIGRNHPWLPKKLAEFSIDEDRLQNNVKKVRKYTQLIDRYIHPRLTFLARKPADRIIAGFCLLLALSIPPLELLPFAALAPAITMIFLSLGLSARDGLLIAIGIAIALISSWLIYQYAL